MTITSLLVKIHNNILATYTSDKKEQHIDLIRYKGLTMWKITEYKILIISQT